MKLILSLILFFTTSLGAMTIDTTHSVYGEAWKAVLGSPRSAIYLMVQPSVILIFADGDGVAWSVNNGASNIDEEVIPHDWNHVHMNYSWIRGWIMVGNIIGASPPLEVASYIFVDSGVSYDYVQKISSDTLSNSYTSSIFSIDFLPNTDTLIGLYNYDQGTSASNNVVSYSSDSGNSWSAVEQIVNNTSASTRAGVLVNSNTYWAVVWKAIGSGSEIRWWKRQVDTDWADDGAIVFDSMGRDFSTIIYDDTLMFCGATSVPQKDSMFFYYGWKHVDSTTWYQDSTYICRGHGGAGTINGSTLTFLEATKSIIASFSIYENDVANQDSTRLMITAFNWVDSTWDSPIKVSERNSITQGTRTPSAPKFVPKERGNIVPFLYVADNGGEDTWLSLVTITEANGVEYITSVPYTASSASTNYVLTISDTVTTGAIDVTADGIDLDLNGFTLGYGASKTNDTYGIKITSDNVTVHGGSVLHAVDDTVNLTLASGIWFNGSANSTLRNCIVTVKGYSTSSDATSQGLYGVRVNGASAVHMIRIVSCDISTDCAGFYQRTTYPVRAIGIGRTLTYAIATADSLTNYHAWVDSCTIYSNFLGIHFYGEEGSTEGYCWASNNDITIDLRNEMPYIDYRIGDGYGIHSRTCNAVRIWDNNITFGREYNGGYGIFIEETTNDYGFYSYITNNLCSASVGGWDSGDDNNGHASAFRARRPLESLILDGNEFYAFSDLDATTLYRNGQAFAINIGRDATENSNNVYITNNIAEAIGDDASMAVAISFYSKEDADVVDISYNHLKSNNIIALWAYDLTGTKYLTQHDDTMSFVQDSGNTQWTYDLTYLNNTSWVVDSFTAINNVYFGGASDTNIEVSGSAVQEILIKYTISVKAEDVLTNPILSANAWCVNILGDTLWKGSTDGSGIYLDTVQTWYEDLSGYDNYNNMTIGVAKEGDTTISVVTIGSANKSFILTLGATEGEITERRKKMNSLIRGKQ